MSIPVADLLPGDVLWTGQEVITLKEEGGHIVITTDDGCEVYEPDDGVIELRC